MIDKLSVFSKMKKASRKLHKQLGVWELSRELSQKAFEKLLEVYPQVLDMDQVATKE